MELVTKEHDKFVHVAPSGKVDTTTAPRLEEELTAIIGRKQNCILDFKDVPYISSMGLRVVMITAKRSSEQGVRFVICGLAGMVKEVFEVSGFNTLLNIQDDFSRAEAEMV